MLPSAGANVAKDGATASSEAEKITFNDAPSIDDDLRRLDLLSGASAPAPATSPSPHHPDLLSGASAPPLPPHLDRPIFHVMPRSSWINDPNGLCFYKGRFHAFYQHLEKEGSADWDWAMAWGHASSADLALWRREPVALRPTTARSAVETAETETTAAAVPALVAAASAAASAAANASSASASASAALSSAGGADAAGCWSGCLVAPSPRHARAGMRPTLLYTGVVLRKDHDAGEEGEEDQNHHRHRHHQHHHRLRPHAPPPPLPLLADLGLEMIERQLVAVLSDEGDERLTAFEKRGVFISHAPYEPEEESEAAASEPEAAPASSSSASSSPAAKPSSSSSHFFRYDSGFRDPFVYQRHDASRSIPWRVLIGSGKRRVERRKKKAEVEKKERGGGDDNNAGGETGSGSTSSASDDDDEEEQEASAPATGTLLAYSCPTPDLALGPWTFEGEVVRGDPGRCIEEREGGEEEGEEEEEGEQPSERSEGEEEEGEEGGGEGEEPPSTSTTKTAAGERVREKKKKKEAVEFDVGRMWECPFLIEVPVVVDSESDDEGDSAETKTKKTTSPSASSNLPTSLHLLCVSPYPHGPAITATGRPANPPLYWLGELDRSSGTFDFAKAVAGPRRLDLGEVLYAPTAAAAARTDSGDEEKDDERVSSVAVAPPVMMAWAQELRGGSQKSGFSYSGALTLPRELSVVAERKKREKTASDSDGEKFEFRLRQRPPASISKLRTEDEEESVSAAAGITAVVGGPAVEIPGGGARGPFADLELELVRPAAAPLSSSLPAAVVLLRPWPHAGTKSALVPCASAAAVVADWETGELSVVWPRRLISSVAAPAAAAAVAGLDSTTAAPEAQKKEGHAPPSSSPPPLLQIDWEAGVSREVGGPCAGLRKRSVTLRVIVDGSLVEVFASSGETLTTRVYRGGGGVGGSNGGREGSNGGRGGGEQSEQSGSSRGGQGDRSHPFYFLARGGGGEGGSGSGAVTASRARAWGMRSCWVE